MKLKMKLLPAVLLTAVLLAGCSKADDIPDTASGTSNAADTSDISDTSYEDDTDSEEEIWSMEGYYLRTEFVDMIIREQSFTAQDGSAETIYEPIEIYFGEGEEGDVPFDSLKTGDKIEADVKLIAETYPGQARIYGLRLIESGDVSNINDEGLLRLEELGRHRRYRRKNGAAAYYAPQRIFCADGKRQLPYPFRRVRYAFGDRHSEYFPCVRSVGRFPRCL